MGRGSEPLVTCEKCKRVVPRSKAVEYVKGGNNYDLGDQTDVVIDITGKTVYYCISCAKHMKLFEKKKAQLQRKRDRKRGV